MFSTAKGSIFLAVKPVLNRNGLCVVLLTVISLRFPNRNILVPKILLFEIVFVLWSTSPLNLWINGLSLNICIRLAFDTPFLQHMSFTLIPVSVVLDGIQIILKSAFCCMNLSCRFMVCWRFEISLKHHNLLSIKVRGLFHVFPALSNEYLVAEGNKFWYKCIHTCILWKKGGNASCLSVANDLMHLKKKGDF